jgi:hypothetical protein
VDHAVDINRDFSSFSTRCRIKLYMGSGKNHHLYRRVFIAALIGLSGCCREAEIPSALKGLYSSDPREKNRSLQVLAQCPQQSEPSVQRIAALMYDGNVGVASSAAYALRKIDSKEAREALQVAVTNRERRVKTH